MSTQLLLSVAFPLILGLIMFGLGLSLEIEDFKALKNQPKALWVGLFIQLVLGPILAFAFCTFFSLPPEISVGLMLLSATPGGPTSNIYSHLARGDLALNISLTIANAIFSIVQVPLIIFLSINYFLGTESGMIVPYSKIVQTMFLVLLPVVLGMWFRSSNIDRADRLDPWIRKLAVVFLTILILFGIKNEWSTLLSIGLQLFTVVVLFNITTLTVAYFSAKAFKLNQRQSVAITFEVGIHNCVLAMTIAVSPYLLNNTTMALPAVAYSLFMLVSAALLARWFQKSSTGLAPKRELPSSIS